MVCCDLDDDYILPIYCHIIFCDKLMFCKIYRQHLSKIRFNGKSRIDECTTFNG